MVADNFEEDLRSKIEEPNPLHARPIYPEILPILPMRNVVIYPYMVVPVTVGRRRSQILIQEASRLDNLIGIASMKRPNDEDPEPEDLYRIGALGKILRMMKMPDGKMHILIQGLEKISIDEWVLDQSYLRGRISVLSDLTVSQGDLKAEALRANLIQQFKKLVALMSFIPDDLANSVANTKSYRQLAYLISSSIRMDVPVAQELLEMEDVLEKLSKLTEIINRELEVAEIGMKIQSDAKTEMDKAQREYFLRQQLKAIRKELGEETETAIKVEEFRTKVEESGMPDEARQEANRELARMEKLPEASAEYGIILTYLDWMTSLPWSKTTEDVLDLENAQTVLDEDHYGLEKIKERILEYLSVRKLRMERQEDREKLLAERDRIRREREGVILCFVGPPGLGKTSLGQSIARALGRKFFRISLGGMRDEAEIRGHRRTYLGAMPGRFIQAMRRVATKNPIIMLDEVDKLGNDWRGDPSSALLEVLDPEQNREFRDHYLDAPFDLSQVMFIATANLLDTIPGPLRDRLEVLHLSGYTDDEKLNIVQKYLLPRQIIENGLREHELSLTDEAVLKVMQEYTREAGVRGLERKVGALCRKIAVKVAKQSEETESPAATIDADSISEYLGKPDFNYDVADRLEIPGVATGLAVTAVGGDILFVEVTQMAGKKGLTVTGQLGDVMKESVEAALSYVRSRADELGITKNFFEKADLHIHIPAGATPKDGPSAGVTLITALTSLLTGRPVRKEIGMTGEITLKGNVLAVGGIKDKVLAAHRAGLKIIIMPKRNQKDLEDLPEPIRGEMEFILADRIEQVLEVALCPAAKKKRASKKKTESQEPCEA